MSSPTIIVNINNKNFFKNSFQIIFNFTSFNLELKNELDKYGFRYSKAAGSLDRIFKNDMRKFLDSFNHNKQSKIKSRYLIKAGEHFDTLVAENKKLIERYG
jgi:hypothetical protein